MSTGPLKQFLPPELHASKSPNRECSKFQKRWCELMAGTCYPEFAFNEVCKEFGITPRDRRGHDFFNKYKRSSKVMSYLEKCKKDLARYYPGGVIPAWVYFEARGGFTGVQHKYEHPSELWLKAEEYFKKKDRKKNDEKEEVLDIFELCKYLNISWPCLNGYIARGHEWSEVVNQIVDRFASYLTQLMVREPKLSLSCNYQLNRLRRPEHYDQAERYKADAERAKAETKAIQEGKILGGSPAVTVVLFGEKQTMTKQIESKVVNELKATGWEDSSEASA